jgi:hypothetical protein
MSRQGQGRMALHRARQADAEFIESFNRRLRDEFLNETLFPPGAGPDRPGHVEVGLQRITRKSAGRRPLPLHQLCTRAGIWRCAPPTAPRQLPPLTPPDRAVATAGADSRLDKTWGQGHDRPGHSQDCFSQGKRRTDRYRRPRMPASCTMREFWPGELGQLSWA